MPKVNAALRDVKTSYEPIEPGVYEMKIDEIEYDQSADSYNIKSIVDEPGSDHHNKPVYDRIYMKKKDGGVNGYSAAQLKRYFEAALGYNDDSDWDNADTDDLKNQRFRGDVIIENYETKDDKAEAERTGQPAKKSGYSNKFRKNGIVRL